MVIGFYPCLSGINLVPLDMLSFILSNFATFTVENIQFNETPLEMIRCKNPTR